MKTNSFLPVLIAFSIVGGAAGPTAAAKTQVLAVPTEVQGVPCQGKIELNEKGKLTACTLARDHTVAGCALPAGTAIQFRDNGDVASFVLSQPAIIAGFNLPAACKVVFRGPQPYSVTLPRDAVMRGVALPARSTVFFWTQKTWETEVPDSWHCWLPQETTIQGHRCSRLADACGHVFYASGKIRAIDLAGEEEIDGVPCTSAHSVLRMGSRVTFYGLDVRAWFYEDGHLAQGMIARDCTIDGRVFRPGAIVRLTRSGKLDPAATTLGAQSRGAGKRTPPDSYGPAATVPKA